MLDKNMYFVFKNNAHGKYICTICTLNNYMPVKSIFDFSKNICGKCHLKRLYKSSIFMVFAKVSTNQENMCCFYTLKISSKMIYRTTWYSDIVYSDHMVRNAFGKYFFSFWQQILHVERYDELKLNKSRY